MARKSSKTARVMNLLAGGEEAENTVETSAEDAGQTAVDPAKAAPESNQVVETVKATSTSVTEEELQDMIDPSRHADMPDPVAEAIKDTLELEMDLKENKNQPKEPEIEELVQPEEAEADYMYVNVMEKIVEDKVGYFMNQFEVCDCERCVVDTKALALTNLPPKYIVTARSTVAPLLNFYSNKFIGQVTVELTKACQKVKEIPHHDR